MAKKNNKNKLTFTDFQPFLHIENDILVSKKGDYSIVMKIEWPECFSYNEHDYELLVDSFASALDLLESGTAVQRIDFYYPYSINLKDRYDDYLEYKNTSMHNGRIAQTYETYLIFTKLGNPGKVVNFQNMFMDLVTKAKITGAFEQKHYDQEDINSFYYQVTGFCDSLNSVFSDSKEIRIRQLGRQEIIELIFGKYFNLELTEESSVFMTDLHNVKNGGFLDDKHYTVFTMYADGLPPAVATSVEDPQYSSDHSQLPVSMLHGLAFHFDFPRIVVQTYFPVDNNELVRKIETKKRIFRAFSGIGSSNRINKDMIEEVLESQGGHKMIKYHFGIIGISPGNDKTIQNRNHNAIKAYLTTSRIGFTTNTYNSLRFLFCYAPGNAGDIPDVDKAIIPTPVASCLGVYEGHGDSATEGVRLIERKTQMPIDLDFWNHPKITNKNILLFGPTGTGKSFTVNTFNASFLQQGNHIITIDVGFSHKNLCGFYGGLFIECSEENPLLYNPFLVDQDASGQYMPPSADIIEGIVNLIYTAWKGRKDAKVSYITREELSVLMRFIPSFYEYVNKNSLFPDFTEFYYFFLDSYYQDELTKMLRKELFDIDSFKLVLADFIEYKEGKSLPRGQYAKLFNAKTNPDYYNDQYIVFELEYIKNNAILFPITYHLINQIVMDKLLKHETTSSLLKQPNTSDNWKLYFQIDEGWLILKEVPAMASFLEYSTRTVRKHNGAVWIITQTVADIFDNDEVGSAIVGNCDIRMLKMHSAETKKYIQEKLNMSDHNLNLLYSISNKWEDIYIQFKDYGCVYGIRVADYVTGLFSTDPQHKNFIQQDLKKTNSLRATLSNFETFYNQK